MPPRLAVDGSPWAGVMTRVHRVPHCWHSMTPEHWFAQGSACNPVPRPVDLGARHLLAAVCPGCSHRPMLSRLSIGRDVQQRGVALSAFWKPAESLTAVNRSTATLTESRLSGVFLHSHSDRVMVVGSFSPSGGEVRNRPFLTSDQALAEGPQRYHWRSALRLPFACLVAHLFMGTRACRCSYCSP